MPCRDDGASAQQSIEDRNKIDSLTRMLCIACRYLEDQCGEEICDVGDIELTAWWKKHAQIDDRRLRIEALEAEIAKLKAQR